jgi:cytochrome c oxidase subunit 3
MQNSPNFERLEGRGSGVSVSLRFEENMARSELPINRGMLGLLIFLGTEAMFFAGLISAFMILRAGSSGAWPMPAGALGAEQSRLPAIITGINTLVLLLSAYTMTRALKATREGNPKALMSWLSGTGVLGLIFLGVQGSEWLRMMQHGLTFASSIYGGIFYTLIGCHALHVFAAVLVLLVVLGRAARALYTRNNHNGLELCRVYWYFVVGLWPVLYVLVYLV